MPTYMYHTFQDIAIFTNDVTRCPYYQEESQNVKSRSACVLPEDYINRMKNANIRNTFVIPITPNECVSRSLTHSLTHSHTNLLTYSPSPPPPSFQNDTGGIWTEFPPDSSLSAPECVESQWSRDNHLGNSVGGYPLYYNWTIPNLPHENCALRIRYNDFIGLFAYI